MPKTIKIKCLDQGKVEIESTKVIFDNETIHVKVEYPKSFDSWVKYLDIIINNQKETVIQQSLSMDHVLLCSSAGTLNLQPYATTEQLDIKWETVKIGIKKSLLPL